MLPKSCREEVRIRTQRVGRTLCKERYGLSFAAPRLAKGQRCVSGA